MKSGLGWRNPGATETVLIPLQFQELLPGPGDVTAGPLLLFVGRGGSCQPQ